MKVLLFFAFLFSSLMLVVVSCKKKPTAEDNPPNQKLSYGDSVFYIGAQEYTIAPTQARSGTYSAFPDNLVIDPATGRITVRIMGHGAESQTGLRYKIKFQPSVSGTPDSTYIILAGINYLDRIYRLSQNDTIIRPIYNGDLSKPLPSGTYGIQPDNRLGINPANGEINIMECIRKGMFDLPLENGEWEEVSVNYRSNDKSNSVTNRIDIALYYYRTIQEIPSNISQLMRAHQSMVLGVNHQPIPITTGPIDTDLPDNISLFKPRPPCVIIVGN
jgi:hypothetical protein